MYVREFVQYLNNSIRLNENVVSTLKSILLSKHSSVYLENTPTESDEYFNQKGTQSLYNRELKPSDVFQGSNIKSPVMDDFSLGYTPDVINDKLFNKVKTLTSINSSVKIKFNTLSNLLLHYDQFKSKNDNSIKAWKKFKIGYHWPSSYGFSDNCDYNTTNKLPAYLSFHESSKYSFIKLTPRLNEKYHYIDIDLDSLPDADIPVIFIILDSVLAKDGDSFEFKITFNGNSPYDSDILYPEVMIFDGSYNSNKIPQPSLAHTSPEGSSYIGNTIKINGVDYYYVRVDQLQPEIKEFHSLIDSDKVFISSTNHNNKIFNKEWRDFSYNLASFKISKYINYGILSDELIKIYSNSNILLTSEITQDLDDIVPTSLTYEQQKKKLIKYNSIKNDTNSISFQGIPGTCIFNGRPSSFYKPKTSLTYHDVTSCGEPIEGIQGNVVKQFKRDLIPSYVSTEDNGVLFEYTIDHTNLNGNEFSVRLGHFETILGLNVTFTSTGRIISFHNGSTNNTFNRNSTGPIQCQVGLINSNGIIIANYTIKDSLGISTWRVLYGSNYADLLICKYLDQFGVTNSTRLQYLKENNIFSHWSPVLTVVCDGINASQSSNVIVKNLNCKYLLSKQQYESNVTQYNKPSSEFIGNPLYSDTYTSARGVLDPMILKPQELDGFICKLDYNFKNNYGALNKELNIPNTISYRVGVKYHAYKGKIYNSNFGQLNLLQNKQSNIIKYNPEISFVLDEIKNPEKSQLSKVLDDLSPTQIKPVISAGNNPLYNLGTYYEITSELNQNQIDFPNTSYGWRLNNYYFGEF